MPALEADYGIGAACQPVDDLAFAFVAPLSADYGNICHYGFPETTHATLSVVAFFCAEGIFREGIRRRPRYDDGRLSSTLKKVEREIDA